MSQTTLDPIGAVGPDTVPGSKQPRGFLFTFVAAWFGISLVLSTLGGAAIPKVFAFLDDATKGVNLSIVAAVGGVVVIVITPLFGRLSDRTMSRLGKRRPWIMGGALVGLVGVVMLAFSAGLWQVIVGWAIVQTGYGATNAAVHALLADQIPKRIRARVSAAASVANAVALIFGAVMIASLPNDMQWTWFIVPGAIGTVFSVLLFFRLHDIVRTDKPEPWKWSDVLSTYWLNPVKYRDFFWAWACRLFVTMSIFTVATYMLYFIIDRLDVPLEEASGVFAGVLTGFTLMSVVTTVVFGWISDRTGRRKAIVWVSALLSAGGLIVAAIAPDLATFFIAMMFVGAAQGAFISVDIAMMTEVLPNFDEAGKDLGIVSLSYQVPQVLVPVLAIPLLAIGGSGENYSALFIAAIVFGVLGALCVLPIKSVR
ncbi:Na+/melibiose symporter [Microbacterium sp. cf046]|uniref:MFS transporter n=1 Tax=Microbacterium sp. cf046 TaxID=1761803 RepID=UPI0008E57BDC|nr:MFS transporter [Microbacterium sp. cf046]SFR93461.1 Na+/melibiose symporter [Microbacterium sp. cf046]